MASIIPRFSFYPTLLYNIVLNKLAYRQWYHQIDSKVILGALPFRSMTEELKSKNVRGVLSLTEDYEHWLFVNTPEEWALAGIEHLHLRTKDLIGTPSQGDLNEGVQFITEVHEKTGGCTYVHCKAGRTRSCTMVACYLMQTRGLCPEEAYDRIRAIRDHVWLRSKQWESLISFHKSIVNPES